MLSRFVGIDNAVEQVMELSVIHDNFRRWVQGLRDQGLDACFIHGFEAEAERPLAVSAVLLTARLDPERCAHGSARRRASMRPLARLLYLIAVGGSSPHPQRERALLSLMLQAQHTQGMSLMSEPPSSSWWLASGIAPRPAFLLEAHVSEAVERVEVAQVRTHRIDMAGMFSVHGYVVAADATPVAGAEIKLLATGQVVRSDHDGTFHLKVGTHGSGRTCGRIRIQARGVEMHLEIPGPTTEQQPWLIRLEPLGC